MQQYHCIEKKNVFMGLVKLLCIKLLLVTPVCGLSLFVCTSCTSVQTIMTGVVEYMNSKSCEKNVKKIKQKHMTARSV